MLDDGIGVIGVGVVGVGIGVVVRVGEQLTQSVFIST
jgi:hypothetical protein